jgi:hypothetical protein
MKKGLVITFAVIGGLIIAALVFGTGLFLGHAYGYGSNYAGSGIFGRGARGYGYSMMGNGYGMMGRGGMMGGRDNSFGRGGMMGGYAYGSPTAVAPLSIDQAKQAVESYLKTYNNPDLELKEVMIFENNAYARITEKSTGIGAMELLVDPATSAVYPEYGPNMMWNQKYGQMSGYGMMGRGGMMGGFWSGSTTASSEMTVSPETALATAQKFLDDEFPGYKTADDADPFYGYYTIDIMKDGQPAGMLSVNGYTGQVFLHTWHGAFIEMWE